MTVTRLTMQNSWQKQEHMPWCTAAIEGRQGTTSKAGETTLFVDAEHKQHTLLRHGQDALHMLCSCASRC